MTDMSQAIRTASASSIRQHLFQALTGELPINAESVVIAVLNASETFLGAVGRDEPKAACAAMIRPHLDAQRAAFGCMLRLSAAETGSLPSQQRFLVGVRVASERVAWLVDGTGAVLSTADGLQDPNHEWFAALMLDMSPSGRFPIPTPN